MNSCPASHQSVCSSSPNFRLSAALGWLSLSLGLSLGCGWAIGWVTPVWGQTPAGINQPPPQTRPILRLGSQGETVSELQAILRLLGYYTGSVDGSYEQSTATAVSAFQRAAGLTADGIAGAETWNRLLPATTIGVSPSPNPSPSPSPNPAPANDFPILRLGAEGAAVSRLQRRLQSLGFYSGEVDGVFGAGTEEAVRAAQAEFGLEPDGVAGTATWAALFQ